jgi:transposase
MMTERTDTMKTYLLREPNPVEPQNARRVPRTRATTTTAAPEELGRPASTPNAPRLFIGLDVHTDSIAVSLAASDGAEVRRYGLIGGTHDDVLRLAKKLQAAHPDSELRFCYEAGPHGYPLARWLLAHGYDCILVAPSKIPRPPGDRVKTNRRDADQLARLYRAGELTALYVPDPQDEAVRDLIRARYQVVKQQHRARQQLKMFLLRHNLRYAGTKAWTAAHLRYLATVKLPFPEQQFLFQEMVNVITEAGQRLARYDAQIPRVLPGWRWEPVVKALMSLRGMAVLTAATLVAELGDLKRFPTARQLMGYLGLVPSEDSTGDKRHQGGITKMGNGIARRVLIEAAWNYRAPARLSRELLKRQEGLSQKVKDLSWAAQTRLQHRYQHLTKVKHKKSTVAAAALGRELSGFVWAVGQLVRPHPKKSAAGKPVSA